MTISESMNDGVVPVPEPTPPVPEPTPTVPPTSEPNPVSPIDSGPVAHTSADSMDPNTAEQSETDNGDDGVDGSDADTPSPEPHETNPGVLSDPDAPGNWIIDPSTPPVEPNEPA